MLTTFFMQPFADLLVYAGRADNWFDIYNAVELAERIVGGNHELPKRLGSAASQVKAMREMANFYRHPRGFRPTFLTTQDEAVALLAFVVRTVLAKAR